MYGPVHVWSHALGDDVLSNVQAKSVFRLHVAHTTPTSACVGDMWATCRRFSPTSRLQVAHTTPTQAHVAENKLTSTKLVLGVI